MEKTFKITTPEGLHARPTALLVSAVTGFKAEVELIYKEKSVNLKSIMGVMSQGILPGGVVTISANGVDADKLMETVTEVIITKGIGEEC
ncbi:phosphocarrier protein HPr [Lysinibacillus contaminans]|uniref:Phosphocarrier protein HPr n=1 Tax=Lysinibacillus contaminans TaxID=1293441 RepID=A0ABR5JZ18_9BACI|nr:HPr family phosphocarrier protein [Lysinibacillus contaminans]KOS67907.1 phosphocarrier protein HPr [Lysinibacillus contaminans]